MVCVGQWAVETPYQNRECTKTKTRVTQQFVRAVAGSAELSGQWSVVTLVTVPLSPGHRVIITSKQSPGDTALVFSNVDIDVH